MIKLRHKVGCEYYEMYNIPPQDVGGDPPNWEGVGRIPSQDGPQDYGEAT